MGAFRELLAKETRRPPLVITLPPALFADTWPDKPTSPVECGIRLISERDLHEARANAARTAWSFHPEDEEVQVRLDAYHDALVSNCAARAACDPADVTKSFFGDMPEDQAALAMTSEGLRVIFAALDRATVGESPIFPEAADSDFARLAEAAPAALAAMSGGRARRLRRLAHFLLAELTTPQP